jgi:arylformamidase
MRYIWLSFPLDINGPRPPAIPAPKLKPLYTVEKDDASVQILEVASHTGTHVDAPQHVSEMGLSILEFSPEEFIFTKPVVIDLQLGDTEIVKAQHLQDYKTQLVKADLALFRFGCGQIRRTDPKRFSTQCPGFGVESARWLRENCPKLRAAGMDVPSLACIASLDKTMASHNELLEGKGRRFLVIEDMNLEADLTGLCEVRINPWLVKGMDSGPCSIIGVFV